MRNTRAITLRDLVKPKLDKHESAAIQRALKNAKKDQDKIKALAAKQN
jgi:hypothetical protein